MSAISQEIIQIRSGPVAIEGMLTLPQDSAGVVLFAHGSGSSRFSPRNRFVAEQLHQAGIATLLLDLLTANEDQAPQRRFDIALLTQRLSLACDRLRQDGPTAALPLGLFGASTGAAAALQLAALQGASIAAVVSRGGRSDLAGADALAHVTAPTLLIVGGNDDAVLELNRRAYALLHCEKRLEIVPGATHLFEEPGRLQVVARLALAWLQRHFATAQRGTWKGKPH